MKDYVLELASKKTGLNAKLNVMREYLQAYILRVMHDQGVFRTTAFLGGTALRFLYGLPRFSEDLDFSIIQNSEYKFADILKKIKDELISSGYIISISYNEEKIVHNAFIRFEGLMHEAGISPLKGQKLSIKVEIDTSPPMGATLKTDIVNKYFPISFLSYDLKSLFAGKLHALLSRKYTKGRDFFDLGWYLSKWKNISPNIELLKNALLQTKWKGEIPSQATWRKCIYETVKKSDWQKINQDVENFLETPSDLNILSKENILALLNEGK